MDIQLPGIDGLSATKVLIGRADTKDIPVIAISGIQAENIEDKAIKAGCCCFVGKPVRMQLFLKLIDQVLGQYDYP